MKRKIFAVFCVALIILTCSLSVFADTDNYVTESSDGYCSYEYLSYINGTTCLPYSRYLFTDLSSIDFASIYINFFNAYGSNVDLLFNIQATTYDGHSCYRVRFSMPNGLGYNAYLGHSNFIYLDIAGVGDNFAEYAFGFTGDIYFYVDYYVSDLSLNATVYDGVWVVHSYSNVTTWSLPDIDPWSFSHDEFSITYFYSTGSWLFKDWDWVYHGDGSEWGDIDFDYICITYVYDEDYYDYDRLDSFYKALRNYSFADPNQLFYLPETVGGDSITIAQLRDLIYAIFQAPAILVSSMLNFEIFGFNIYAFVTSILTICLLAFIVGLIVKLVLRLR